MRAKTASSVWYILINKESTGKNQQDKKCWKSAGEMFLLRENGTTASVSSKDTFSNVNVNGFPSRFESQMALRNNYTP